jgi:glycosyltransferase involved in cell wall biosynthesis
MSKSVLFLVNNLGYFVSHRLPIALAAQSAGYVVTVAFGEKGKACLANLESHGFDCLHAPIRPGGVNPFAELWSLLSIWRLFLVKKPDLVHLVTIRPYLYGGIAARMAHVPAVISAVAGLGSMFIREDIYGRLFRRLLNPLFRSAFGHKNQVVIVQNLSDRDALVEWGVLDPSSARLLRGSGVDLMGFLKLSEVAGTPIVAFAARLLRDKGVNEFILAARLLRTRGVQARFWLIGDADPSNPTSITQQELLAWKSEGVVQVLGYRDDIEDLFAQSHIVCLPSYREGLPKTLIEAAAAGRAVVTTDVPGCRDAIIPNETGLLVSVRDAESLADALQWLIEHPRERAEMGRAGRALAEREFGIEKIVDAHLKIYQELLDAC